MNNTGIIKQHDRSMLNIVQPSVSGQKPIQNFKKDVKHSKFEIRNSKLIERLTQGSKKQHDRSMLDIM